jgi:hypothetical protein
MALPSIKYPTYETTLPSTGEVVRFRPFTVEDEKLLLTANESTDELELIRITKELIKDCVKIDNVEELTTYDVDYLFIQLRKQSISPISELYYRVASCENNEWEACDKTIKVSVNLDLIGLKSYDEETNDYKDFDQSNKVPEGYKVELGNGVGMVMKHPGFAEKESFVKLGTDDINDLAKLCVVSIYDDEAVYTRDDFTDAELDDYYNKLTSKNRKEIIKFIQTIPQLHYETIMKCNDCGYTEKLTFKTLEDFFG